MKKTMTHLASLALIATAGMFAASASFAATKPKAQGVYQFSQSNTTHVFNVRPHSWSDPAFGFQGWTHHSDWGRVRARRGSLITIKLTSTTPGLHPAATVWFRGGNDTAPDAYVPDHFYPQLGNYSKIGAISEETGEDLGNIIMRYVRHGYDHDNNSLNFTLFNPIRDQVPGQLELSFQAPQSGVYMFVVGGINPDADSGIDNRTRYNFNAEVTVSRPQ